MSFKFYNTEFSRNMVPYVIAEIGHNHQGSFRKALELTNLAQETGVQSVKFQKKDIENLYTKQMLKSDYLSPDSFADNYGNHKRSLEFSYQEMEDLKYHTEGVLGLHFLCTAFDFKSAEFLESINVQGFKIGSCDIINTPLIGYIASFKKPVFLSTGAATIKEIDLAVETVEKYHTNYVLFHCVSAYPCEYSQLNLSFIGKLICRYPNAVVGYSGHESGILAPSIAYMLGATVFEKHFTFNRAAKGTDHKFSLEPQGMKKLVRDLNRIAESLGDGVKDLQEWELAARKKLGKSLYVYGVHKAGTTITIENVSIKAPGLEGIPPYELDNIIGKRYNKDVVDEEPITWEKIDG